MKGQTLDVKWIFECYKCAATHNPQNQKVDETGHWERTINGSDGIVRDRAATPDCSVSRFMGWKLQHSYLLRQN